MVEYDYEGKADEREKGERKRRMMQTPYLSLVASLWFLLFFYVRLPLSSFLVFLFLFISLVIRSSSFSDGEKARS